MTDRQFADCCYGSDGQHAEWVPCPVPANEMTETHPGHWNDNFNNTFVDLRRGYWVVSIRAAGNRSVTISKHIKRERALAAAAKLLSDDQSIYSDHSFGRA